MTAIIVEGLDRCGKTTQIKRMMKYFMDKPIQWLHYSALPGVTPSEQTEFFKKTFRDMFRMILTHESTNWILDRSHLGEAVYAPLYRPQENPSYVWYLEGEYRIGSRADIALIILLDSSLENLKRDDGDSLSTDVEMVKKEIEGFKQVFRSTSIQNKILIDIAGKSIDQVSEEIRIFLSAFRKKNSESSLEYSESFWQYLEPDKYKPIPNVKIYKSPRNAI